MSGSSIEVQNHDLKLLSAIIGLARLGTDKKILRHLRDFKDFRGVTAIINQYYTQIGISQRKGSYWLRCVDGRLIGDRILRLFVNIYPDSAALKRDLTAPQLLSLFRLYHAVYPGDEVTPNRIYYFFLAIRSQDVVVIPECPKCSLPYIVHQEDGGLYCGACEGMRTLPDRLERARRREQQEQQERVIQAAPENQKPTEDVNSDDNKPGEKPEMRKVG